MDNSLDTAVATKPGVRLHINDSGGTGRPVVLIHGWPLNSGAWAKQVPALEEAGYRVISYDRRGFGQSEKPDGGFDYDTLAADLAALLEEKDLRDVTLVGFSMGGGEVARYIGNHGEDRLHSVVLASAVTPFMMQTADNPAGPLTEDAAEEMEKNLKAGREAFFDGFTKNFFTADESLQVSEEDRQTAIQQCLQSDQTAALGCMEAFGTTDFREDLEKFTVPTLVLHGDADGIVPIEGSGLRAHKAISQSRLVVIQGGPHGCNVSHPQAFNDALLEFLA
ncbi:alpha/beta fold hydrolase [Pseudoroseicyclus sp. H15]